MLSHHFAGKMIKRKRGGILFVSSMIGHMPNPYFSNYAGSKAYILNLGTSLNGELKKYGIYSILTTPENLTIDTINKYLEIKARGLL